MIRIITKNWERISKASAKKLFREHKELLGVLPHNMHPENKFMPPFVPHNADNFEKFCNSVAYYNCNKDTGRYLAYYKKIG